MPVSLEHWLAERVLSVVGNPPVTLELWDGVRISPPTPALAAGGSTESANGTMPVTLR